MTESIPSCSKGTVSSQAWTISSPVSLSHPEQVTGEAEPSLAPLDECELSNAKSTYNQPASPQSIEETGKDQWALPATVTLPLADPEPNKDKGPLGLTLK